MDSERVAGGEIPGHAPGMTDRENLLRLVRALAAHPVLPPSEALPSSDETLHAVLGDLARAARSSHVDTLRAVSRDTLIPVHELARRAGFLLACLLLPTSGTHYEVLGVGPHATKQEIRKRWAVLIHRYHPDRLGGATGGSGWLDGQASRLIEAYHTLKDPARRRAYDARLAGTAAELPAPPTERWRERTVHFVGPTRWKWAPAAIALVGIGAGVWASTRPAPRPLPIVPLPAAPRLLERWGSADPGKETLGAATPHTGRGPAKRTTRYGPSEPVMAVELPSLKDRLGSIPGAASSPRSPTESPAAAPGSAALSPLAPPSLPSPTTKAPGPASPPQVAGSGPRAPTAATVPSPPPPAPARLAEPAPPPPRPVESAAAPALPSEAPASALKPRLQPAVVPEPPSPVTPPAATPAPAARKPALPAVATATTPATPAPAAEAPARGEVLALIESFRAAYERKDLTTIMGLLGAEARDRKVAGRQAVEQLYVRNFAALDGVRYDLAQLGVRPADRNGDVVVEGRFRIRATRVTGEPRPLEAAGPIRWVIHQENGALRIVGIEYEVSAR